MGFKSSGKCCDLKNIFYNPFVTMQTLASCNLLGVIEGSNSEKERIRSAKETSQRPVAGTEQKENITRYILNQCSQILNFSGLIL